MPPLRRLMAALATLSALVAIATCIDVTIPSVEPALPAGAGRRSLLGDLAGAVRDAAWPDDGGAVLSDVDRRLMEADANALGQAVTNRSLALTAVTSTLLGLAGDVSAGLAVTQPLSQLDACLVWQRRPSTAGAQRDGLYFLTVFHSSVWSVLLLCLLCAIAILTLLESGHPIGMRQSLVIARARSRRHRSADKPMGVFHALAFAVGALLLMGYPRGPKSTSGRILALFWWMFAFVVAAAYLSATVLVFLTTRSLPDGESAGLDEILRHQPAGRVVMCSAGSPLCADWARPEPLVRANFTTVASDSAGLELLLAPGNSEQLLMTHQFACANLLAVDTNRTYSLAMVAKAAAWVSLAGPMDLVRLADSQILRLLGSGQPARLERQHGIADLETFGVGGGGSDGSDWLVELKLGLPYRIDSMVGPAILLIVGLCLSLITAFCEFFYYRFFIDTNEMQLEIEELEQKGRAFSVDGTMDTYL